MALIERSASASGSKGEEQGGKPKAMTGTRKIHNAKDGHVLPRNILTALECLGRGMSEVVLESNLVDELEAYKTISPLHRRTCALTLAHLKEQNRHKRSKHKQEARFQRMVKENKQRHVGRKGQMCVNGEYRVVGSEHAGLERIL
ncbi:hypothetical protein FH972_025062 [Carpinus fangiana]|uniref:Uncharacterized protein n=1 Tax=Carpinus fangiana TaxID=176857 RepID=A0A5N6L0H0_9ROSI|nr:hypothetical protein FH972_025062 [Carpinus fangiana]